MVGFLAFLVWTCVLGSSYVRSQETADESNSNPSTQITSSPTNSETELNVGNIQDVTLPKPDIQVTEATVKSSGLEPVKPLAQQTDEDAASVNQASKTEPPATNANPAPVIKTAPVAPVVTQSPAVVNQIPAATLERPTEPINTTANTIEKVAEVNPIQLAPAATNGLESVTMPSNPASSVTIPSTGSTRLNAALDEERAAEPINTASNTVEKVSAKNPIPAEPEPKVTDPLSTALDTAFTEIVKPASAVTKPTSLAANSVPIEVNPEILSVTETTNSFPATNIAQISENPATATEPPELIREIVVSAVSEGSAGTTETSEPSGALVNSSAKGDALVNSPAVANATSAALGTAQGGYLVNISPVANTTSTGITALNTDEEDASSTGFKDTAEDRLITSTPIDPRVILQKRIDQDVIRLGAKLQGSIDFYAESRENLKGLLKDINLRHEIAEVALTNLRRILAEIITRPTKKVKLAEVFKKAIGIRDTPIAPVDTGASALV